MKSQNIAMLERAASTEQMILAANDIAVLVDVTLKEPSYTLNRERPLPEEEVRQLISALAAGVRWVKDAESVAAWARAIAHVSACEAQLTKDAFATPAIVDKFPQLVPYATTAEAIVCLADAIFNITDGKTQSTKDAFSTSAIVKMFTQLAPIATPAKSVERLTMAIGNITKGLMQGAKDAFAVPSIVAMFSQLAPYATTADSVQSLGTAISNITGSLTQATKDAFATPAIVAMFSLVAPHATTAEAVCQLAAAIFNITDGMTQARKDTFAIPAIVEMFIQLAPRAMTAESVQRLTMAVASITNGPSQATKDAFATYEVVKMFIQLASVTVKIYQRADCDDYEAIQKSILWLASAIVNITAGTVQDTKDAFADPAMVKALQSLAECSRRRTKESSSALEAALAVASLQRVTAHPANQIAVEGIKAGANRLPVSAIAHSGVDCILRLAIVTFPAEYRPAGNAQDAILQCGLSATNLPLIAKEAAAIAADRLARLPPVAAPGGPVRLPPDLAVAIAAYTYDLGFSSADPTGAGSDNFYCCLNAALRQRAQSGGGLMKLKPILCYLFRGLEALPAAVDKVVYRGVPSSCNDVVRKLYLTGANVHWTSFTSTSEGIDAATQFASTEGAGGVIFRITSLTGRYVHWYSSMPCEGEVIFSPTAPSPSRGGRTTRCSPTVARCALWTSLSGARTTLCTDSQPPPRRWTTPIAFTRWTSARSCWTCSRCCFTTDVRYGIPLEVQHEPQPADSPRWHPPRRPPHVVPSPFSALAGVGDRFSCVEDLTQSLRSGLFLDRDMVPVVDFRDFGRHDGESVLINARVTDFFEFRPQTIGGRSQRYKLEKLNGLSRAQSLNTLSHFNTIVDRGRTIWPVWMALLRSLGKVKGKNLKIRIDKKAEGTWGK